MSNGFWNDINKAAREAERDEFAEVRPRSANEGLCSECGLIARAERLSEGVCNDCR
jgi:hypothetical protein